MEPKARKAVLGMTAQQEQPARPEQRGPQELQEPQGLWGLPEPRELQEPMEP